MLAYIYMNYTQQTRSHCWIKVGPLFATLGYADMAIVIHQVALILLLKVSWHRRLWPFSSIYDDNMKRFTSRTQIIDIYKCANLPDLLISFPADRVTFVGVHLFIYPPEVSRSSFSRHSNPQQPACIHS